MVHKPLLPYAKSAARAQQIIEFSPLSRARNAWNSMTAIHSSPATLLSRLAQSGSPSGVLHTRQRETGFTAGPATLFASSAFGLRAAQLNALAGEAETSQQVGQVNPDQRRQNGRRSRAIRDEQRCPRSPGARHI